MGYSVVSLLLLLSHSGLFHHYYYLNLQLYYNKFLKPFYLTCVCPAQCEDGEVRLVEGESETEGRVEVCINKRWGTICRDTRWSDEDATTVCRQLGYWEGI